MSAKADYDYAFRQYRQFGLMWTDLHPRNEKQALAYRNAEKSYGNTPLYECYWWIDPYREIKFIEAMRDNKHSIYGIPF